MLKNYFKTAFRNLARNKWVALISVLGLSVGMASGLLSYWLANFNYRANIDAFTIMMPLVILCAIILLTVSLKVWRSMRENIVEELRYE